MGGGVIDGAKWRGRGRLIALAGMLAASGALWLPQSGSAAVIACKDVKDNARQETVFAIRASGTTCALARTLAAKTGPFGHTRNPEWVFRHKGFICRGGWSWDETRAPSKKASSVMGAHSEGVSLARWRCTKGKAFVRFVRSINYGG